MTQSHDRRDERRLAARVRPILERLKWARNIDVYEVATEALSNICKDGCVETKYPDIYIAANHAFRQVTRAELRRKWAGEDYQNQAGSSADANNESHSPSADDNGQDSYIEDQVEHLEEYTIQLELFDKYPRLQPRYPRAHARGRPQGYVLVQLMTEDDWNHNLDQLETKIAGLRQHFKQLLAYGEARGFVRTLRSDAVND